MVAPGTYSCRRIFYWWPSGGTTHMQEKKLYNKRNKQAHIAPCSSISFFFSATFSLLRILINALIRKKLFKVQAGAKSQDGGAHGAIFFSFNYIYFRKKSPILAAAWTMADAVLATASLIMALKNDKKLALNYLPLVLWTGYASTIADYQALKNPDPALHTVALLK